jgi:endoglucanase
MIKLAQRLEGEKTNCDLYMASTIQEEIGVKGAEALAGERYDSAIALDIGLAGDYPALEKGRMPINLGDGPVIVYKDNRIHYNIEVIKELKATAEQNNIPYQHGVFIYYGSDSGAMIAGNTKPNLLAPPCRYSHLPIEMIHEKDLENTVELLYHYLTNKA